MRDFYNRISKRLDDIDFEAVYPGFHRFPFALYDDKTVWLSDREIEQKGFFGNTAIEFEGKHMAIWNVQEDINTVDIDIFTSNIVHEMFHAFQKEQNMNGEAPSDMKLLMYPEDTVNYIVKQQENVMIADAFDASPEKRADLYHAVNSSRELRKKQIGEFMDQELLIEKWEGVAESCKMLALKQLSQEKYEKVLKDYQDIVRRGDLLLDIRKNAYYTGTLMRLLGDEVAGKESSVNRKIADTLENKKALIEKFMSGERTRTEAPGMICGYDPMNQIRLGDKLLAKHFLIIQVGEKQETLVGETLVEMKEGSLFETVAYWR